jgi:hypothetical protein
LQVLARTSKVGTGGFVAGRSFGVFGIRNRLRLLIFRIMFSQVRPQSQLIADAADSSTARQRSAR